MKTIKIGLFGKTKKVEVMIDDFLDHISEGGRQFKKYATTFVETGLTDNNTLYFELRKGTKPVDPLRWLVKRP